jgi:hypothetical protein
MKKAILFSATALACTLVAAESKQWMVGGAIGSGSGTLSYETDNASYTLADDGIDSTDTKLYVGYGNLYGFVKNGTLDPAATQATDMDYSAIGVGYLAKFESLNTDLGFIAVEPEGFIEIGYDKITESNTAEAAGLLLGGGLGVAIHLPSLPNVSLTASIGYDIHAVKEDASDNGTWNFRSMQYLIGARANF